MIYTSYYGNFRNLEGFVKIGISTSQPFEVDTISKLFPGWDIVHDYKSNPDNERYVKRYTSEILSKTSPEEIVGIIRRICRRYNNFKVVLLCYEKRGDFCHRHIVADWLTNAGYPTIELEE